MERTSNPGSATPELLFRMYRDRAAATANPFVLREMQTAAGLSFASTLGTQSVIGSPTAHHNHYRTADHAAERESLLQSRAILAPIPPVRSSTSAALGERRRADSPPRGHFRVVSHATASAALSATRPGGGGSRHPQGAALCGGGGGGRAPLSLTLNSLDMSKR